MHYLSIKTIKHKKAARLSGLAAVVRHMVPLGKALADKPCNPAGAEEAAIKSAVFHMYHAIFA